MTQSIAKKESMSKILWLHCTSPLHVGAGRGLGYIDLPIMREKTTNWPFVPGSSIKGVIADHFGASKEQDRRDCELKRAAFGQTDNQEQQGSNSGSLVFTDARLVCLPVRSLYGTFTWCTSPLCLARLARDFEACDVAVPSNPLALFAEGKKEEHEMLVPFKDSCLIAEDKVYLEDLDFEAKESDAVHRWAQVIANAVFPDQDAAWRDEFVKRFSVVSEEIFSFLCETGTQIDARIRIQPDSKTVAEGALWYEESLPAETILAGIAWCDAVYRKGVATREALFKEFCTAPLALQVGGKASVGRGRVHVRFQEGA